MHKIVNKYIHLIIFGVFGLQLVSCGSNNSANEPIVMQPTSTISPLFLEPETSTPLPREVATATLIAARPPSLTAVSTSAPTVEAIDAHYTMVDIYDEKLLSNWTLKNTVNMKYKDNIKGHSFAGVMSIAATPQSTGQLQFSVLPSSKIAYKRDEVAGFSFWISSDQAIAPEDFLVTVLGSNDHQYWIANDTSVKIEGRVVGDLPVFSETRLYYLNFNRPIEPKTWAQVIVWIDDLIYEPDYTYVTALYIKNDERFQEVFYIDKVSLILYKK